MVGKSLVLHSLPKIVDVTQQLAQSFLNRRQLVRSQIVAVHSRDDNHQRGRSPCSFSAPTCFSLNGAASSLRPW